MTTRSAEMPALPKDPNEAKAVVRKMVMDEAIVLLKASGLKYTTAQFDVPISFDDGDAQNGDLLIEFKECTDADVQAVTDAIWNTAGNTAASATASASPRVRSFSSGAMAMADAASG